MKIRVSLVRFRLWAPPNSLKSLEYAENPSVIAAHTVCRGLPQCGYDSCMANACKSVRADTDFKQILRWWVCRAPSHRRVSRRMHAPTDLQQLQYLKMFRPYRNQFISLWFDMRRQCRVETTIHEPVAVLSSTPLWMWFSAAGAMPESW